MAIGLRIIENIVGKLSENFEINSRNCVRVRHKGASCTKCLDVCDEGAIRITSAGGNVVIDWLKCTGCLKCMAVCGNDVFSAKPVDKKRMDDAAENAIKSNRGVIAACGKSPYKDKADLPVPALAFFNRKYIIRLVSSGVEEVIFIKGDCASCSLFCIEIFERELNVSKKILSLSNNRTEISLAYEPPVNHHSGGLSPVDGTLEKPASRREFFSYIKNRTILSVGQTIQLVTESEADRKRKTVFEAHGAAASDHACYTDDLEAIGGKALLQKMTDDGILFAVRMDMGKCTLCGVCSRICPHAVFTLQTEKIKGIATVTGIEKSDLNCTGCGLCMLSCPAGAIVINGNLEI